LSILSSMVLKNEESFSLDLNREFSRDFFLGELLLGDLYDFASVDVLRLFDCFILGNSSVN